MDPYSTPASAAYESHQASGVVATSPAAVDMLAATRPWVMFITVMLFIGSGFMLLAAIAILTASGVALAGTRSGGSSSPLAGGLGFAIAAVYLVLALVNIAPAIRLCQYAAAIGRLVRNGTESDLILALDRQRSFWKLAGIMTIVVIGGYIVLIVSIVLRNVAM